MKLIDLHIYNPITIQCHDNPDADALSSGYGLYLYFKRLGKDVRIIYSGNNCIKKSNLLLMIEKLQIPIQYVTNRLFKIKGLLITVDCQYGAGNVSKFHAEEVAVIDHHQLENKDVGLIEVDSSLGSCATLVWKLLKEAGFPIDREPLLENALYYGLYSDTNQFAEIYSPLDLELWNSIQPDTALMSKLSSCNLSLQEMEIAGNALRNHKYHELYRYTVVEAEPCDPNILGFISDLVVQVDTIDASLVYNNTGTGYKLSIRSCTAKVNAAELAAYLTENIGSGGGNTRKAGGSISKRLYFREYPKVPYERYFLERMEQFFVEKVGKLEF